MTTPVCYAMATFSCRCGARRLVTVMPMLISTSIWMAHTCNDIRAHDASMRRRSDTLHPRARCIEARGPMSGSEVFEHVTCDGVDGAVENLGNHLLIDRGHEELCGGRSGVDARALARRQ